jgi:CheY-like chemotaxis protein
VQTPILPERSKILIVDDEPFNVDYLEQELTDLGYETISARNGQEALEKVATEAPDLILLDVMMPIMDGFTVCRILKDYEVTRLIPIVIMTALDAREDRIKGIKAGADDFLTKPVHEEELLARIATALKLKHTVDRKIGELHELKAHLARFVRLVTTPDLPSS